MHMSHHIVSAVTNDRLRETENARRARQIAEAKPAPARRTRKLRTVLAVALSALR